MPLPVVGAYLAFVGFFCIAAGVELGTFGLDRRPLEIVPNLISVGGRRSSPARTGGPHLVSVGDAGRLKNIRGLLLAFLAVRQRHPAASLRLVGPGLAARDPLAARAR